MSPRRSKNLHCLDFLYICPHSFTCERSCAYWSDVLWATWEEDTTNKNEVYFRKGVALSNCTTHTCSPLELIITNPVNPLWKSGEVSTRGIDGMGLNPYVQIQIRGQELDHPAQACKVYKSFYKEILQGNN